MNTKIYYDVEGLSSLVTSLKDEINKYSLTIENLYNEYDKVSDYWKGPDADVYLNEVLNYMKKVQMLKLILDDYVDAVNSLTTKLENHPGY